MSIFGGNTGITYEQLQQRRKMADQLRAQNSQMPQNVGQGIHAIAKALVARGMDKQNTKRTAELKDQYSSVWGDITGSLSGGQPTATPFNPSMSGASSGGGQSGGGGMERYRNAIASIESDGSGGYQAIGPTHPEMGRALGRYQVMEANLPQWSREAVGREVTPEEYLASPEIQDAIFDRKFGGYIDQFGEQGAAQAWFAGPGGVGKTGRKDSLGTSVGEYTNKFQGAMGGGQGGGVRTAQAGGIDPSIAQMAQLLSAPDEFMPPGQKAVVQALLQRKLQASDPMRALDMQMKQAQLAEMQQPDPMQDLNMQLKQAQLDQMQNPQPDYPSSVEEYNFARQNGFEGGYQDWVTQKAQAGASNVSVTTGDGNTDRYLYGSDAGLPTGWRLDRQTGKASEIPGGPAAVESQQQEKQAEIRQEQTTRSGGIVLEDINRIRDKVENSSWYSPVTGAGGSVLSKVPGTDAYDTGALLRTVGGNIGFDRLQQMRDASPTGGALGAINQQELNLLMSVMGSLEQSQSEEQLMQNLDRLDEVYRGILDKAQAYPNAEEFGFGGSGSESSGSSESTAATSDYSGMNMDDLIQNVPTTDAEAAAWNKRFDALQGGQ